MSRKPRLFLPDQPQHVVVRGHNREPVLARDDDFRFLYRCLREASQKYSLAIHAMVFMNNHIHLLVTPADMESLPKVMQSVRRCLERAGILSPAEFLLKVAQLKRCSG